jgi:hypothetical protein
MFELNFRDERYLPFEGVGVISEWELSLNENENLRLFDYNTISDVIMHFKYTAREDAGDFKTAVVAYLQNLITATVHPTESAGGLQLWRMFSLKHDYPTEFYKLFHPSDASSQVMNFTISANQFPYFTQGRNIIFKSVYMYGYFTANYTVKLASNGGEITFNLPAENGIRPQVIPSQFEIGSFTLTIKQKVTEEEAKDIAMVVEYQLG